MRNIVNFILWPAVAGLMFALALLLLPAASAWFPGLLHYLPRQPAAVAPAPPVSYSAAIRQAAPAVVSINSQQMVSRLEQRYDLRNPFLPPQVSKILQESNSLGSGVIISSDGYIITSNHIFLNPDSPPPGVQPSALNLPGGRGVEPQRDTTVTLNDGRELEARRLMLDEESDLALLKVDADNLPHIDLGSTASLRVGDVVLAIGNPRNIGQSVSMGIVSALLRRNDSFVIQTDAAINPGNSGGALIDVRGRLIGINSSIVSESGGSEGIGFAIPVGKAITLLENYLESGPSGYLGVEVDSELVSVQATDIPYHGFRVNRVPDNSPADRADIRAGDIIVGIDGTRVNAANNGLDFIEVLSSHAPGEMVNIEVLRAGEYMEIPTELGVGEPMRYWYYEENPAREPQQQTIN